MITAVLCAAGSGERAGLPENKIFYELNGLPVLSYSLSAFAAVADEILVACREEEEARVRALLSPYPAARTVQGGKTRFFTVLSALKAARGEIVLIHDAARPFVTQELILSCAKSAETYGSGVSAVPLTDTVAAVSEGVITDMPPRSELLSLQTPQGFRTEELRAAYAAALRNGRTDFTDDSGVFAAFSAPPHVVMGDRANRKLTYPEDFLPAERVGFGVDTHAFAHQDEIDRGITRLNLSYITLCGAVIPSNRELSAHSDGDAAVHALMDALLSAIGERDIGFHFPDTDPAYKGISSMRLLGRVMDMVRRKGFEVANASLSILLEAPRLSPYIETMRQNLCAALGCEHVAVAAGTNEKLGYVGEGRGVTAYATVLLRRGRK